MSRKLVVGIVAAMLALGGCGPKVEEYRRICPGKSAVLYSLSSLTMQQTSATELRANGQCRLQLYVEGKSKPNKENFPVKLWFSPPCNIRVQGNVALDPRAIELGSNKEEFWLGIRPKEVSRYVWGKWSEQEDLNNLAIRPDILVEALGVVSTGSYADMQYWSLSNEGPFDILTRQNIEGRPVKKIYVYSCDYRVAKIEHLNEAGEVAVTADLRNYKQVTDDFFVPSWIKIVTHGEQGRDNSVRVTLSSPKAVEFSDKQRRALFERRPPKGFKSVGVIVGGELIEQYE
jgi:hypothetical protein